MVGNVNQQTLNMIANPTGGGLAAMGQAYQSSYTNAANNRRADERLSEEKKTALLTRQVTQQKIDAGQVDALLSNSKILSGVTAQFMADSKTNPMLRRNPKMYEQYMMEITKDLPEDVIKQFQGVNPNQFPRINRRANRMVKVLSDLETVEQFGAFEKIKDKTGGDTGLYGQPSLSTNKYANVKPKPGAGSGGGAGDFKPATINEKKLEAADKALSDAGIPVTDATKMDYLNAYERYFRETGSVGRSTRAAISDMKQSVVKTQDFAWGGSDEYLPTDEAAELSELEALEASGEI